MEGIEKCDVKDKEGVKENTRQGLQGGKRGGNYGNCIINSKTKKIKMFLKELFLEINYS